MAENKNKFDTRQHDADAFIKNEINPVPLELKGPYSKVPNWKCVDFWMGGASNSGLGAAKRANWRSNNYGPINFAAEGNAVKDSILLIPEGNMLEVAGGLELDNVSESFGNNDFLSILSELTAVLAKSMSVPQWKPKVLKGLKNMSLPTSYKFKFHYGAGGLYDAFEEVVKPIYALVQFFGVLAGNDANTFSSPTVSGGLPYPTKGVFIAEKVKGALKGIPNVISTIKNSESAVSALANANNAIQSALASGAAGIAQSEGYHNLWISWGRFTLGPFQYQDIKYSFDMSQFDSNGWPLNGEFEIGGIESMRVSSTGALISPVITGA